MSKGNESAWVVVIECDSHDIRIESHIEPEFISIGNCHFLVTELGESKSYNVVNANTNSIDITETKPKQTGGIE